MIRSVTGLGTVTWDEPLRELAEAEKADRMVRYLKEMAFNIGVTISTWTTDELRCLGIVEGLIEERLGPAYLLQ